MDFRVYSQPDIAGKRVLLRLDLDVEVNGEGQIDEFHDLRLERAVDTIQELLSFGAKQITLCGHRGRPTPRLRTATPAGKFAAEFSLEPVKDRLEFLLNKAGVQQKINLVPADSAGNRPNDALVMLENLRFWPGEKINDEDFAASLGRWGEVYVNDAFGNSHRADASMVGITKIIARSFAGPGLLREVANQENFLNNLNKPFIIILGGIKISTKLPLIKRLLASSDAILLGGGLANTVLAARGVEVGQSVIEPDMLAAAKDLNEKIVLPEDFMVLSDGGEVSAVAVKAVSKTDYILDVGLKTLGNYAKIIGTAKSALWNGPMGKFEDQRGRSGTEAIAQALVSSQAKTLVGGGDTVVAVEQLHLTGKFGFVSVGGGAMLTFLSGEKMPGLEVLQK